MSLFSLILLMHMNYRVIIFVWFYFLFAMVSSLPAATIKGKVVKVADGDTVTIIDNKGFKYRVRLAGIDAPEKGGQPYSEESTKNLKWLVYNKGVTADYTKLDRYGRVVGKVLVDQTGDAFCLLVECSRKLDVGLEQIKAGLAWHYKRYEKEQSMEDREYYTGAERVAKKKHIGLWSDKNPVPPWKWRRDRRLSSLKEVFVQKGSKEKKYAQDLGIEVERLKSFLDEAIKNEDEAIKKAFETSGLEEEKFAEEFKVSPERLKSILNPK